MNLRATIFGFAALAALHTAAADPLAAGAEPATWLFDMTHHTPGEPDVASAFHDPKFLASWGYNGELVGSIEGLQTFDTAAPGLLPPDGPERRWMDKRAATLAAAIRTAHAAGIRALVGTDMIVLPKAVVAKFRAEICDDKGRIDIHLPRTQELVRTMMRETFARFPDLDGLVIRTGEVYLQDFPYHTASGVEGGKKILGNTAILHGPQSHIDLINVLRDEVCVKLHKTVIYRTWDFGNNFHVNPKYYLEVTDAVEPHPDLFFSIKHQAGDFHQLTPFNPTLTIGKHRQIIEVQCQREAYGKGAHPYYVGKGVIDGWEEYAWMMKPGQPKGLRDVVHDPHYAGVWTWSRGGGWEGPYIQNEFWCALNAYVVSQFARDPARSEEDIFDEYAGKIGLHGDDVARFRELCLLSAQAVLRGQLTTLGAKIDVWWARDHFLGAPDLSDFIKKGLVDKALAEKADAVRMWRRIELLANQLTFPDPATKEFVVTSAAYGRIKYAIIEQGWTILLLGAEGDAAHQYDRARLSAAISAYDGLWDEWRQLQAHHPLCSTLYKDVAFGNKPGMGAAVDRYRQALKEGPAGQAAPEKTERLGSAPNGAT